MEKIIIAIVVVGFVCILAIGAVTCGRGVTVAIIGSQEHAVEEARAWNHEMGYMSAHVSCMDRDTDGDGYVSCTVRPAGGAPFALGCAEILTLNKGCKIEPLATVGNAGVPGGVQ